MLKELKEYLNITWEDNVLDNKLNSLIDQSRKAINNLMGVECDYNQEEYKELLFNRVRYAYNNCLEYFEPNFAQEILRLQLLKGVERIEK